MSQTPTEDVRLELAEREIFQHNLEAAINHSLSWTVYQSQEDCQRDAQALKDMGDDERFLLLPLGTQIAQRRALLHVLQNWKRLRLEFFEVQTQPMRLELSAKRAELAALDVRGESWSPAWVDLLDNIQRSVREVEKRFIEAQLINGAIFDLELSLTLMAPV